MIMNKYIKSVAAVLSLGLLFACQPDELVSSPEFTVTDAAGNVVLSYTEGNQYNLDLTAFQYAVSANKSNEIAAAEIFSVASNMSWKLVAAEEGQDWIRPFPEEGDKEGRFLFLAERNNDQTKGRTAYYNIYVDDGAGEKPVPGMIIVNQAANVDFLKVSVAKVDINNSDTAKKNIAITSNLDWTYEIVPDDSYGTEDLGWLKDLTDHPAGQQSDTVTVKASNNANGMIRGALVKIICDSKPEFNKTIPVVQFGKDVDMSGFPIGWTVGAGSIEASNFSATWPAEGYGEATTGTGRFMYVEADGKSDPDKKFARTVGATGDPYVTGAWPGDYWAFVSDTPVSSGTILKIAFESRVSATGHKFWRLEYLDGEEWKIAGKALTTEEPGHEIVYTHAMNADGSTNIQVSASVKYATTTPSVEFRFVCAANWQANGKGALAKPNGGTARLSLTKSNGIQPSISCVAAGTEDMTPANVAISGLEDGNIMTFEGEPAEPKTFTVTSDKDFTVKPAVSWLTVENGSGAADESKVVVVTCAPSELSSMRKGVIEVKSGVTKINIPVVQSAAGGELDPLISVIGGNNLSFDGMAGTFTTKVQANVEYEVNVDVDWIKLVPATKGLVDVDTYTFTREMNLENEPRTGHITFYNSKHNLMAVIIVTQDTASAKLPVKWLVRSSSNFDKTWPVDTHVQTEEGKSGYVNSSVGNGTIWFNNACGIAADSKKKCLLDVTDASPRVTGVWIGDYCQFKVPGLVGAGRKVRISFECRTSAKHPKYWRLKYWDGDEWKDACETKTIAIDGEGDVVYTHAMEADGSTNIKVDATVTYSALTENIIFRFECVTAMQSNNSGLLKEPNGGTWRLSVTKKSDDDEWQPTIRFVD